MITMTHMTVSWMMTMSGMTIDYSYMLNAYELTAHGLGITIYPAAAAEYASEDVCIKPLSHPAVSATYILIRSNSRTHSLVAREFWDAVPTDRASL